MAKGKFAHLERLEEGPPIAVYLDPGSFAWLKEILEAKQLHSRSIEPYQRLVKRTLLSFQEAEKPPPPRKRVIPRR